MSCYSTTCSCSRCREGMTYEEHSLASRRSTQERGDDVKGRIFTEKTKASRLKELMLEFPERSVDELLKVLEVK